MSDEHMRELFYQNRVTTRVADGNYSWEAAADTAEPELHSCGYPDNSFACRIRHQHISPRVKTSNSGHRLVPPLGESETVVVR